MKRKIKTLTCFLIGLANGLPAQTDTLENNVFGGFVIFPIEFPVIENEGINSELAGLGYPKLDYPTANVGVGLQLYMNRWITTFSFNKTTKKDDSDTYVAEVEYRSTSFNIGYDLTGNYQYSIYPFIGFKGCGLNYYYREKVSNETGFNNYFNTGLEYKEITNSRANLDLGFGASFQRFFLINLRAGYLLPLEEGRWKINNNQDYISNSPILSYHYYFTLTIGFGRIASDNDLRRHFE